LGVSAIGLHGKSKPTKPVRAGIQFQGISVYQWLEIPALISSYPFVFLEPFVAISLSERIRAARRATRYLNL
jgi:hypothetical protein